MLATILASADAQIPARERMVVVISLDASSFGPLTSPVADPFGPLTLRKSLDYVLSLQSVEYSVRTIDDHFKGKVSI